jgi:PII-like signaling protein
MTETQTGKILRVHVSERGQCNGKPLYEAIIQKSREMKLPARLFSKEWRGTEKALKATAPT